MIANCSNYSAGVTYEYGYVNNVHTVIGCQYVNETMPYQIIPLEYQGWAFLIFAAVGIAFLLYGIYMIATDPRVGKQ